MAAPTVLRTLSAFDSPLGPLIAGSDGEALCLLEFCDVEPQSRLEVLAQAHGQPRVDAPDEVCIKTRRQLEEYFAGQRIAFDLPLRYGGTPFQHRVWDLLCEIAYGETWSYLELARRFGDLGATRAVGAANGRNPIAIVVPCHRVINANGALGGYGGGLWRKRKLLDLERGQRALAF